MRLASLSKLYSIDKKKNNLPLQIKKVWQLYLLLLIPFVYIIIFAYVPMLGLQIAFRDFNPLDGIWRSPWAGLKYFIRFFNSYEFTRAVSNTVVISLYSLIAGFPIPIILALCLNCISNKWYKKIVQTFTYIPHFISVVVLVGMVLQLFSPINGIYGNLYRLFSGVRGPDIVGIPTSFSHLYVWSGVWQSMGWNSIIYIAALASADTELHEAIQIDGASRFQRVIYIDIPCILPTVTILLILNAGKIMTLGFEKVYLMQNTLNMKYSEVISTYVYKIGIASGGGNFSYATAIGLFNSVVNFLLIVLVNATAKKMGQTSLW